MNERFVDIEFSVLKRLAAFISDLLYAKDDLNKRLLMIENGQERLNKLIDDTAVLVKELIATGTENQKRQLYNTIKDYKVEMIPKLANGSSNIVMTKIQAKQLIELAQEKCKNCVENSKSAQSCALYQFLEVTAVPDSYDSLLCPFSQATWAD